MHPIDIEVKRILALEEQEQLKALETIAKEYGWTKTVSAIFSRYAEIKYR